MKLLLLSITCLVLTASSGQKIPAFYDYKWTPCPLENARYFSEVIKTDSGWLRNDYFLGNHTLQMKGLYEDSATKIANVSFIIIMLMAFRKDLEKMSTIKRKVYGCAITIRGL